MSLISAYNMHLSSCQCIICTHVRIFHVLTDCGFACPVTDIICAIPTPASTISVVPVRLRSDKRNSCGRFATVIIFLVYFGNLYIAYG